MSKKQNWYFSFLKDQAFKNNYVKIYGTREYSMKQMYKNFGQEWGVQYSSYEDIGICKNNLTELKIEKSK